jgi:predicted phosphohydrolase
MAANTTRLFIISDTHDGFQGPSEEPYPEDGGSFRPPLPKADILLHSGDLTMLGRMNEYRSTLKMLKSIDAELKLVIAGNHDLSLHKDYYLEAKTAAGLQGNDYQESMAAEGEALWNGPEAKAAGVTYLTEGLYNFTLKNGTHFSVYASPWQPEFYDWAFNYPHNEDRWNPPHLIQDDKVVPAPRSRDPHPIPEGAQVDIMITHGPPFMHLDKCRNGARAGCTHLLKALNRVRPKLHCFGHIHEAWGAEIVKWGEGDGKVGEASESIGTQSPFDEAVVERHAAYVDVSNGGPRPLREGKETLLVNSCVMDLQYNANGAGWLVDIDLPRKEDTK